MTIENKAKQFADNISGLELICSVLAAKDKNHAYRLGRYDGFLAGYKEALKAKVNITTISDVPYSALKLEEAKEILKDLMVTPDECTSWYVLCDKAEQFLKEIEK